jgi:hypothetical protein
MLKDSAHKQYYGMNATACTKTSRSTHGKNPYVTKSRIFEEEQINASYTDGQQSQDRTK